MKTILSVALVVVLSLALGAPASAGGGSAGGVHVGFHGGFHGGSHHGFRQFGCCFRPAVGGGAVVGSALAYPDSSDPYAYPDPAYLPAPAYQPQTQVAEAQPVQPGPEICYPSGCYYLHSGGATGAYSWTWVPAAPTAPPNPPTRSSRAN